MFLTKRRAFLSFATVGAMILALSAADAQNAAQRPQPLQKFINNYERDKNVILFTEDGMSDSEITIARNYALGAAERLALDTLPLTGEYTTQESNPKLPDYMTDCSFAYKTVTESAQIRGYNVLTHAFGLQSALLERNVLGLSNAGNLSLEWASDDSSQKQENPQLLPPETIFTSAVLVCPCNPAVDPPDKCCWKKVP